MRPHHPWFRSATNSWYVEIGGQQQFLGNHPVDTPQPRKRKRGDPAPRPPVEIEKAYHRLMASSAGKLPEAEKLHVATVCDLFLDFSQKHHTPDTYRSYQDFLQDFCTTYGMLLAADLKPLHVSRWLDSHPGWNGARRNAVVAVKRVFNWAELEGLLDFNPIKKVVKPPQRHRDRVLSSAEREQDPRGNQRPVVS